VESRQALGRIGFHGSISGRDEPARQQVAVPDHARIRSAACRRKNFTNRSQLVTAAW